MWMEQNIDILRAAVDGAVALGFAAAALFFRIFWKRHRDRLFFWFGWAFLLFSLNRVLVLITYATSEKTMSLYLLRLAGILIILYAILEKNRRK